MFLQVCVILFTGGGMRGCSGEGACMVALVGDDMRSSGGGGGAWLLRGGCMATQRVGGCAWLLPGGHAWLLLGGAWLPRGGMHGCSRGGAWLLQGGVHGCSWGGMRGCSGEGVHGCSGGACMVAPVDWGGAWDTTRYGDTINERAVRILLECILVHIYCYSHRFCQQYL